jgi:CRISPR/Cas system-associated endonuclease Cas3-HD
METEEKSIKEEIALLINMMQQIINGEEYKGKEKMIKQYSDLINEKIQQQANIKNKNKQKKEKDNLLFN